MKTHIFYNATLIKPCQIDYEGGFIDKKYTLIHTRFPYFSELNRNLNHKAIVCMSMGDNGLEIKNNNYYIGTAYLPHLLFKEFNPNIFKLFTYHSCINHPNIIGVPCGTMTTDGYNQNYQNLKTAIDLNIPKTKLLYLKFTGHNHHIRPNLINLYINKKWATVENPEEGLIYFKKMKQHKFVLCPRGNGPDSYRVWEALLLGCIPIVSSQEIGGCHHYFKDLPILQVKNWNLTEQYLENVWLDWSRKEWNWNMLYEKYWIDLINREHKCLLQQ